MDPAYVESVWWSLKQIFDKGLLVEDYRVAPYCPRCGTGLSDHELAQGYETVVDPSVYVRFPLTSGPLRRPGRRLLVWTTTPWTLVSNTAVAVHPDVDLRRRRRNGERDAGRRRAAAVAQALGEGWTRRRRFTGAEMERWTYQRPFDLVDLPAPIDRDCPTRTSWCSPTTSPPRTAPGLVHQAPAFGADDLAVCRALRPAVVNPVDPTATSRTTSRWSAASSSRTPTPTWSPT